MECENCVRLTEVADVQKGQYVGGVVIESSEAVVVHIGTTLRSQKLHLGIHEG